MLYVNGKCFEVIDTFYRTDQMKFQFLFKEDFVKNLKMENIYMGRKFHVVEADGERFFIKEYLDNEDWARDEYYLLNFFKDNEHVVNAIDFMERKLLLEYVDGIDFFKIGYFLNDDFAKNVVLKNVVEFMDFLIENNLHGLFELHPKNILVTNTGFKIIDMDF